MLYVIHKGRLLPVPAGGAVQQGKGGQDLLRRAEEANRQERERRAKEAEREQRDRRLPRVGDIAGPAKEQILDALENTSLTEEQRKTAVERITKTLPVIPQIKQAQQARAQGNLGKARRLEAEVANITEESLRNVQSDFLQAERERKEAEEQAAKQQKAIEQANKEREQRQEAFQEKVNRIKNEVNTGAGRMDEDRRFKVRQVINEIDNKGLAGAINGKLVSRSDANLAGFTDAEIDQAIKDSRATGAAQRQQDRRQSKEQAEIEAALKRGELTKLSDGTLVDTKMFEALPKSIRVTAKRHGFESLKRMLNDYNKFIEDSTVAVAGGQRIAKADFEALSKTDQRIVKDKGVKALNEAVERRNEQAQKQFEAENVKLSTGEYIDRVKFNKLPKSDQRELKKRGVAGFLAAQQEPAWFTPLDRKKIQRLFGAGKDKEAEDLRKQIMERRPLLTGTEAFQQSGRAAVSLVPVVGTIADWGEMNNAMRAISVASDIAFVLGATKVAADALKSTAGLRGSTRVASTTARTQQAARTAAEVEKSVKLEQKALLEAAQSDTAKAAARAQADYFENALKLEKLKDQAAKLGEVGDVSSPTRTRIAADIEKAENAVDKARGAVRDTTEALVKRYSGGKSTLPTTNGPARADKIADDILDGFDNQVKAATRAKPRSRNAILKEARKVRQQLDDAFVRATRYATPEENLKVSQRLTDQRILDLERRYAALRTELNAQRAYRLGTLGNDIDLMRANVRALQDMILEGGASQRTGLPERFKYQSITDLPKAERELRRLQREQRSILREQHALFDVTNPPRTPLSRGGGGPKVPAGRSEYDELQDKLADLLAELKKRPDDKKLIDEIQQTRAALRTASRDAKITFSGGGIGGGLRNLTAQAVPASIQAVTPSTITPVTDSGLITTLPSRPGTTAEPDRRTTTRRPLPGTQAEPDRRTSAEAREQGSTATKTATLTAGKASTSSSTSTSPSTSTQPSTKPGVSTASKITTSTRGGGSSQGDTGAGPRKPSVRFDLPHDLPDLPPGVYPAVVVFKQGIFEHRLDLRSGERDVRQVERAGEPDKTFRVVDTMTRPPKTKRYDMGVFDYVVGPKGIRFVRDRTVKKRMMGGRMPRPRSFGRRR